MSQFLGGLNVIKTHEPLQLAAGVSAHIKYYCHGNFDKCTIKWYKEKANNDPPEDTTIDAVSRSFIEVFADRKLKKTLFYQYFYYNMCLTLIIGRRSEDLGNKLQVFAWASKSLQ